MQSFKVFNYYDHLKFYNFLSGMYFWRLFGDAISIKILLTMKYDSCISYVGFII